MKKIILLFALLLTHSVFAFHAGLGFGWNTIDETFYSNLSTTLNRSGLDRYETQLNRLAPVVTIGHEYCFCDDWMAGFSLEWKYLNYKTANEGSSRGQILPNATFSSINIFGGDVHRDFTSKTHLNNQLMLLASLGKELLNGYGYLSLGPVFFDASNNIYVTSVHVPNGAGDHLISTYVKSHKLIWGGAARIGYQYNFSPSYFININYTYVQTGKQHFNNSIDTALLNGFTTPSGNTLFLKRAIEFTVQAFDVSINWAF